MLYFSVCGTFCTVKGPADLLHSWQFTDLQAVPPSRCGLTVLGVNLVLGGQEIPAFQGQCERKPKQIRPLLWEAFCSGHNQEIMLSFHTEWAVDYVLMALPNRADSGGFLLTRQLEMTAQFSNKTVKAAVTFQCKGTMFAVLTWTQLQLVSIIQIKCYLGGRLETRLVFQHWDLLFPDWWRLFFNSFNDLG